MPVILIHEGPFWFIELVDGEDWVQWAYTRVDAWLWAWWHGYKVVGIEQRSA